MTAADNDRRHSASGLEKCAADVAVRQIDQACRAAVEGRQAARALALWLGRFGLSEAEFQVLWCLRTSAESGLDQTTLAHRVAISTAQVSATVERLRLRDWIEQRTAHDDRRRHRWQLARAGHELLLTMLATAEELGATDGQKQSRGSLQRRRVA